MAARSHPRGGPRLRTALLGSHEYALGQADARADRACAVSGVTEGPGHPDGSGGFREPEHR